MAESVTIDIEGEFTSGKGYGEDFDLSQGSHIDVTGDIGAGDLGGDGDFDDADEKSELMKDEEGESPAGGRSSWICFSIFSVERYQKYFNVSTGDVLSRVFWGAVPRRKPINEVIKKNPDLYGPFWVCMTLVVLLSVALHVGKALGKDDHWNLDFGSITIMLSVVYVYAWIIATVVWAFFWWRIGETSYSLLQTICIYGYSMSGYNLALFVVLVPIDWLKWLLVLLIGSVTGLVLIYPFWDLLKKKEDKKMAFILGLLFTLHVAVAVAIKFLCLNVEISYILPHSTTTAPSSIATEKTGNSSVTNNGTTFG
jgi:hypothetical protein